MKIDQLWDQVYVTACSLFDACVRNSDNTEEARRRLQIFKLEIEIRLATLGALDELQLDLHGYDLSDKKDKG